MRRALDRKQEFLLRLVCTLVIRQPNAAYPKTNVGTVSSHCHRDLLQERCNGVALYAPSYTIQ